MSSIPAHPGHQRAGSEARRAQLDKLSAVCLYVGPAAVAPARRRDRQPVRPRRRAHEWCDRRAQPSVDGRRRLRQMLPPLPFGVRRRAPASSVSCPFCGHAQPMPARRGAALSARCRMYVPAAPPLKSGSASNGAGYASAREAVQPLELGGEGARTPKSARRAPRSAGRNSLTTRARLITNAQAAAEAKAARVQQAAEATWRC